MADLVEDQGSRGPKPRGFVVRFWENVQKGKPEDCWIWKGPMLNTGYGSISIANIPRLAHRVSFLIAHGKINPDLLVMHSCDNRKCVNPSHLSQGTDLDNIHDAWVKGRLQKGERNGMAKLSESDVLLIRREYESGKSSMRELAERFSVYVPCIWRIVNKLRWKHL